MIADRTGTKLDVGDLVEVQLEGQPPWRGKLDKIGDDGRVRVHIPGSGTKDTLATAEWVDPAHVTYVDSPDDREP